VKPRLLIVEDEPDVRLGFSLYLARADYEVIEAASLAAARRAVQAAAVDGVLLDLNLPDGHGLEWVAELRHAHVATAIIVVTGHGDVPTAVEAMRRGADHFLTKPVNMGELEVLLRKALEVSGLRRSHEAQQRLSQMAEPHFGRSASMRGLLQLATLVAENDSPVLLQGETGVGKGLLARWIHERGPRRGGPFVGLSCAGLRGELLASELFGHARGAFTSAVSDQQGLLDAAHGGTLFLDEIGELSPEVQAQFLKVLEEKRYRRLGEVRERRSDFRLISATNRNLTGEVQAGRFREDLHYRIDVFSLTIPPLRERPEDIPGLASSILASFGVQAEDRISAGAMARLRAHAWPGNVRELKNALERALMVSRRGRLQTDTFQWLDGKPAALSPARTGEAERIQAVLREHAGDVQSAAGALGISRATLYRRLQRARGSS
jgi:DNA-binding NtrC family response regulator